MQEVDPTFFTDTMSWEWEGHSAKSLSELQEKLPDCRIKEYYPEGYTAVRDSTRHSTSSKMVLTKVYRNYSKPKTENTVQPLPPVAQTIRKAIPQERSKEIDKIRAEIFQEWEKTGKTRLQLAAQFGIGRSAMSGIIWREQRRRKGLKSTGGKHKERKNGKSEVPTENTETTTPGGSTPSLAVAANAALGFRHLRLSDGDGDGEVILPT